MSPFSRLHFCPSVRTMIIRLSGKLSVLVTVSKNINGKSPTEQKQVRARFKVEKPVHGTTHTSTSPDAITTLSASRNNPDPTKTTENWLGKRTVVWSIFTQWLSCRRLVFGDADNRLLACVYVPWQSSPSSLSKYQPCLKNPIILSIFRFTMRQKSK